MEPRKCTITIRLSQLSHLLEYLVVGITDMPPHGGLLSEGGPTHWALIRSLPCVGVHVVFKVMLLAKHTATDTAGKPRGGWQGKESGARALQEKQRPRS